VIIVEQAVEIEDLLGIVEARLLAAVAVVVVVVDGVEVVGIVALWK
jgi:hypothetical protein